MPSHGHLARAALLALLIWPVMASGQGTTPAPAAPNAEPPKPPAAPSIGPAFQSGGIKVTVTSLAAKGGHVGVSLLMENKSAENLMVAVIGAPLGLNGGNSYSPEAIGGIASCIYNPSNASVVGLDRAFEISGCLKGDKEKPRLTPDVFTLIEAGNAITMSVAFGSFTPVDPDKDFSFSMNVAVFKEADLNPPDDNGALAAKNKSSALPKSLRYLSVGIGSLPLNQK